MDKKNTLRKKMVAFRAQLVSAEKKEWDQVICQRIYQLIKDKEANVVHTFLPMEEEIDIFPLIKQLLSEGITIAAPEALSKRRLRNWILHDINELQDGIYGTQFPANSEEYTGDYDLIIVPGLAFDKERYRLGYGAGYYDTFLAKHPEAFTVGIAYPFQMLEEVPTEAHDVRLDSVIY